VTNYAGNESLASASAAFAKDVSRVLHCSYLKMRLGLGLGLWVQLSGA
jgi:hypothetical protein